MLFSSAISLVGLCYSIVIMCLYLWKRRVKSERKVANLFFTILVIFLVFLGFLDIGCVVAIAGMDKHPVFTEVLCRMHILADIIFTSVSLVYIYSVTINEALITNYTKVRRVLGASLIVIDMLIYLLTFMLPIAYHTNINPNYLLICGPGMYPIYILSLMGAIASVIMIWKYKKTNPKELTVPVAYFSVVFLFFSIIVFVVFEYRFNMIYIMYVFLINALFFTVESYIAVCTFCQRGSVPFGEFPRTVQVGRGNFQSRDYRFVVITGCKTEQEGE